MQIELTEQTANDFDEMLRDACKGMVENERARVDFWARLVAESAEGRSREQAELRLTEASKLLARRLRAVAILIPTATFNCGSPECDCQHRAVAIAIA